MYKSMKYLLEHPVKAMAIIAGVLFLWALVVMQLPEWAVIFLVCALCLVMIVIPIRQSHLTNKEKEQMNNLSLNDFKKMYAEYEALVEDQIRLQNYDRNLVNEKWLEDYHELFYIASRMLDRTKFTDFHIASCMIFALVSEDDSLSHVRFVYDCIISLISAPRVYFRHLGYGGMITLEVEERWLGADIESLEENISADEICTIIKEVYIRNHNEHTLIELANFLKRLYNRCR